MACLRLAVVDVLVMKVCFEVRMQELLYTNAPMSIVDLSISLKYFASVYIEISSLICHVPSLFFFRPEGTKLLSV